MENLPNILNKKILAILKNGYRYSGLAVYADESFVHVNDDRTGRLVVINRDQISSLEVFP